MKYFIDSEFNDDGVSIDLISLAIVCEDGREMYVCSTEAQLHRCGQWLRENVLPKLPPYGNARWMSRSQIRRTVEDFVLEPAPCTIELRQPRGDKPVEFWGYVGAYDWVAFAQLWGRLLDVPKQFPKFIREVRQFAETVDPALRMEKYENAHNALADARMIRAFYNRLESVEDVFLVVRRGESYLDGHDVFGPYSKARQYSTSVAFDHAEEFGGGVLMVLPGGRKLRVTREDFES